MQIRSFQFRLAHSSVLALVEALYLDSHPLDLVEPDFLVGLEILPGATCL